MSKDIIEIADRDLSFAKEAMAHNDICSLLKERFGIQLRTA